MACPAQHDVITSKLAQKLLRTWSEEAATCDPFLCRLCEFASQTIVGLQDHIDQNHCSACTAADQLNTCNRRWNEYRKRVLFLVSAMGPAAAPWQLQRTLMHNYFDKVLFSDVVDRKQRGEEACVVCARLLWSEDLHLVFLFTDTPSAAMESDDSSTEADDTATSRGKHLPAEVQQRLCELFSIEAYVKRWPHIAQSTMAHKEILASSVQHPFLGTHLLLHRRRMPLLQQTSGPAVCDFAKPCKVCGDCKKSLFQKVPQMPRFALANDNWLGRSLPPLTDISAGTRKLLPMVRVCVDVTVLGPKHMPRHLKQKGLIGNHILVPQANPSQVRKVLPPPASATDVMDHIAFILVGSQTTHEQLKRAPALVADRTEYDAAVACLQSVNKCMRTPQSIARNCWPYLLMVHLHQRY